MSYDCFFWFLEERVFRDKRRCLTTNPITLASRFVCFVNACARRWRSSLGAGRSQCLFAGLLAGAHGGVKIRLLWHVCPPAPSLHASQTEHTRSARHQGAAGRTRQRDRTPRIPLRRTQPDPPSPGALPRAVAAQYFWSLHTANHSQEPVHCHWARARSDRRIWAVSCTFFLFCLGGMHCRALTAYTWTVPVSDEGTGGRAARRPKGVLVRNIGICVG
jgi:hypothetical protein